MVYVNAIEKSRQTTQPLKETDPSERETKPYSILKETRNPLFAQQTRKRILIVDDNSDLRKIFTMAFGGSNFEVSSAVDGLDAIEQLNLLHPDLLIVDVNMPKLSGFDVLKYVRGNISLKHTRVIVVTGNCLAVNYPEAEEADLFLVKPVDIVELVTFAYRILREK